MKIKQEVKDLCIALRKELHGDKEEFERIRLILKTKYGFTTWTLLALFGSPPTIKLIFISIFLIMEAQK